MRRDGERKRFEREEMERKKGSKGIKRTKERNSLLTIP